MERDVPSIENDFNYQKVEWPILRVGWILMGLFLLCGIAGLFGDGPLGEKKESSNKFTVQYDRFLRHSKTSEVTIESKGLGKDSSVIINADYTNKIQISSILPEPKEMIARGGRLKLKFSSADVKHIVFYLEPFENGNQELMIEINGVKKTLKQFIYF